MLPSGLVARFVVEFDARIRSTSNRKNRSTSQPRSRLGEASGFQNTLTTLTW